MWCLFKVIYLETKDGAWSLRFAFLHKGRICFLKFKLLSMVTPKGSVTPLDLIKFPFVMVFSSISF